MRLSEQEAGLLQYNTPPVPTHNSVSKYSGTDRPRVQCLQISLLAQSDSWKPWNMSHG